MQRVKCKKFRVCFASVFLFGALLATSPSACAGTVDEKEIAELSRNIGSVQASADEDYLRGDSQAALDRFSEIANSDGWRSLFVAANVVWIMHPAESFKWHMQAYELSGHDNRVLRELAYDYTRREECEKAVEAWTKLDRAGMVGSYMPMLAGYCYLKLGKDRQAFSMFDRAKLLRSDAKFEDTLAELWGPPPPIREHADRLRAFKESGAIGDLQEGMRSTLRFSINTRFRGVALLAYADAAKSVVGKLGNTTAQLECLRPAFEKEAEASEGRYGDTEDHDAAVREVWKQRMDACGLLINGHSLPEDSVFVRLLVVSAIAMEIASAEDLLHAHGKTLSERANAQAGDIEALRILAALQEQAKDPGLRETDELGWSRYGDAEFALSRVAKLLPEDGAPSPEALALLDRAHRQFPEDQRILNLWLRYGNPPADIARAGWRQLALMEFRKPSLKRDPIHITLHAMTLYVALDKYRKAMGR